MFADLLLRDTISADVTPQGTLQLSDAINDAVAGSFTSSAGRRLLGLCIRHQSRRGRKHSNDDENIEHVQLEVQPNFRIAQL